MSINFGSKAFNYEQTGLVQKRTSLILLEMMDIADQSNVLDLGCGPGGTTRKIAALTKGRVLGIDVSEGMINEARRSSEVLSNLDFQVKDAADLGYKNEFDRIFCNSAFQWFSNPYQVLAESFHALKPAGIMGIQAPATTNYCPVFLAAMARVAEHPQTGPVFSKFQSPYIFLESAEDYTNLFSSVGFQIISSELVKELNCFSVEEAFGVFQSGAENGYLNQQYYEIPIDDSYIDTFRRLVKETFQDLANSEGMLELSFVRVYLLAKKPE